MAGALLAATLSRVALPVAIVIYSSNFPPKAPMTSAYPFTEFPARSRLDDHSLIRLLAMFSWGRGTSMSISQAPRDTIDVYVIGQTVDVEGSSQTGLVERNQQCTSR